MSFDPVDIWTHMSIVVKGLAFVMMCMSLATVGIMAARVITFSREQRRSMRFAKNALPHLTHGDFESLANRDEDPRRIGYLGRVFRAGVQAYKSAPGGFTDYAFESTARALEKQGQREIESLRWGTGPLGTIATTAPFVGLLATVIGIVNAFQMMATHGSGGISVISGGVAEALVGTAAGLFVAIPAVFFVSYLNSWVEAREVDISGAANDFLDAVGRTLKQQEHAGKIRAQRREKARFEHLLQDQMEDTFDALEVSQPGPIQSQ